MKHPGKHSVRRLPRISLLAQLLGVYLLFVALVLGIDFQVNQVAQQQVKSQVQTTDIALAQEIALDTAAELQGDEKALTKLGEQPAVQRGDTAAMRETFRGFKIARSRIKSIYWLTPGGRLELSLPPNIRTFGTDVSSLSIRPVFQAARAERGPPHPVTEDGIVDLTTYKAVDILAFPVHNRSGRLVGILATNISLDDLDQLFKPVISSQRQQHQHLVISIVDAQGKLIASPDQYRLLQSVLDELPVARAALQGHNATSEGTDAQGKTWLYSAVPIRSAGWAVVVQRSARDALAVVTNFQRWIEIAAGIFALGGLLFWLVLLLRVVRPLQGLARRYATLPQAGPQPGAPAISRGRTDEVGDLARTLGRLERDVLAQLTELHTLLETSNAVVTSLDPIAVGRTIIREVQRLVDIQAAAVFVPDEDGVLRVLVSEGRNEEHDRAATIGMDDLERPPAVALREGRPVQRVAGEDKDFPPVSYEARFRALLAVPIVSRHVGGVVLVVHRTQPQRFTDHEVELLLTFANYATLAWEHAVLYERSDERLQEVARENEHLYRQASAEKQTLGAIISSMSDGLILSGIDGKVLYSNPGASAITGLPREAFDGAHISRIHECLRSLARDTAAYDRMLEQVDGNERTAWLLETDTDRQYRAISIRRFEVRDDNGLTIGHGLLLRDVTREREVDQFKTTLIGAVGHELRTPLASIKGYASTLLQKDVAWPSADRDHFLETISSEADRLAQMVTNILDLSRVDAGLLPLHREAGRLDDLVAAAARRTQISASSLVIDVPPELPLVDVDRVRLEVVLHNLLANACAYGDGRVQVTAERRDDVVVVHVADNGSGIDDDELPYIFERFYRAREGSKRRSGGTGLGLAISKAFVEAHGGTIWVQSSERGTTFSFSLPIAVDEVENRPPNGHVAELVSGGPSAELS